MHCKTHPPARVCMCVHTRVWPRACTFSCRWLWACVCVLDWHVVDLLGTGFSPVGCLSTADDWQLICGPEISVLEKELSRRHAASNLNWSHLVRFLWQNMCVRLVMRTGQASAHEGGQRPREIRFEHALTAAFWACHCTCVNSVGTFALALLTSNRFLIDA